MKFLGMPGRGVKNYDNCPGIKEFELGIVHPTHPEDNGYTDSVQLTCLQTRLYDRKIISNASTAGTNSTMPVDDRRSRDYKTGDTVTVYTGKAAAINHMRLVAGATACSDCRIATVGPDTAYQEVLAQTAFNELIEATPDNLLTLDQQAILNINRGSR